MNARKAVVPKGEIENKEFDMDKNVVDDLLKAVSPELIAGYEAKNLDGKTLSAVNEEYKAATQQKEKGMSFNDWFKLAIFSASVGFILGQYLMFRDLPTYIALLSLFAMAIPPFLCLTWVGRKFENDRETRYRCEPILRDFRQAVKALDPIGVVTNEYKESFAHYILVGLALRVIESETKFKKSRMMEEANTADVLMAGNLEVGCRSQLEKTLEVAQKFGLSYNKTVLFREAEKIME